MRYTSTDFFKLCISKFKQIAPKDIHELFSEIGKPSKAGGESSDMHKMQFSAFLIASTYLSSHKVVRRNKGKSTPLNLFHIHTIPSGKGKSFCHDTFIKPLGGAAGTFCKLQFAMLQSEIKKESLVNLSYGRSRSLYFNSVTSAQLSQSAGLTPKGVLCSFPEYDEVLKKGKSSEHFNESQAIFTSAFVGDSVNQQNKGDTADTRDLVDDTPFISGIFATQPEREDGVLDSILTLENLKSGYVSRLTLINTTCPVKDLEYKDSNMRDIKPWETDSYKASTNNLDDFYEKLLKSPTETYQINSPDFSDMSMDLLNYVRRRLIELWETVAIDKRNKGTSYESMERYFELKVTKYVGLSQSLLDASQAASIPVIFSSLTDEDLEKLIGAVEALKQAKKLGDVDSTKGISFEMESYFPLFTHVSKGENLTVAEKYRFSHEYKQTVTSVSNEALEFGTMLACWSMMETLDTVEGQASLFTPDTDSIEQRVLKSIFKSVETIASTQKLEALIPVNDYRIHILSSLGSNSSSELITKGFAEELGKDYSDLKKDTKQQRRISSKLAKKVLAVIDAAQHQK